MENLQNLTEESIKDLILTKKDVSLNNSLKSIDIESRLRIQKALSELQHFRGEDFAEEKIINWILEFENLGFSTEEIIDRIQKARYTNSYGQTKFSDFIDEKFDELIPKDMIFRKAKQIIENNNQKIDKVSKYINDLQFTKLNEIQKRNLEKILVDFGIVENSIPELTERLKQESELSEKIFELKQKVLSEMNDLKETIDKKIIEILENIKTEPKYQEDIFRMKLESVLNWVIKKYKF